MDGRMILRLHDRWVIYLIYMTTIGNILDDFSWIEKSMLIHSEWKTLSTHVMVGMMKDFIGSHNGGSGK